ncbi:MAG: Fe-S cluster assembly protein SufD [Cyanobacteria bacterium RI_101]|nr:Fe-S cluster assembly protein SufD [Cyanobacteria bacterium RI_101]
MANAALLERDLSKPTPNAFLKTLLPRLEAQKLVVGGESLAPLRRRAQLLLPEIPIPSRRDEDWLFTDLSGLFSLNYQPAEPCPLGAESVEPFILPESQGSRLVFLNGHYAPELSDLSALPQGVYVGNLAGLSPQRREKLPAYLTLGENDFFSALNSAGLEDVALVWVEPETVVKTPIHLLFLALPGAAPLLIQPRLLVVAEAQSQITLAESYGAVVENCSDVPQKRPYLNNVVAELYLRDGAQVIHTRNQRDSGDAFHIARTLIHQAQHSRYQLVDVNLGAGLSRHNPEIRQNGAATETELLALTALGNRQVADTHSAVYLNHPQGAVKQLHKCIVDDYAQAVFNGKILVPQAAQLANASQLNRNLMLSPKARINAKPELQITADNVKCAHGATISQLEADEIFYLQSRGLNDNDARHLLLDAFAGEILDQIPLPSLAQRLKQCVACRTL